MTDYPLKYHGLRRSFSIESEGEYDHGQSGQSNSQVHGNPNHIQPTGGYVGYSTTGGQALSGVGGQWSPGGFANICWDDPIEPEPENTGIKLGEVIGWRAWEVFKGRLYSSTMNEVEWTPGEPLEAHKVGAHFGEGIHAFKNRKQTNEYVTGPNSVVGEVAMWGQIYEFDRGWHAEFAQVHSLQWMGEGLKEPPELFELREIYAV